MIHILRTAILRVCIITKISMPSHNNTFSAIYRFIAMGVIFCFTATSVIPPAYAQNVGGMPLPIPGHMVPLSAPVAPAMMAGLKIDPQQPWQMNFFIQKGDQALPAQDQEATYTKLIQYFPSFLNNTR